MTEPALPIKKSVELQWRRHALSLDVAQELFSSHQVDRGSRMLLDSLDPARFPETGHAADFGCGYGVLGIAWQVARPGWSMAYVDRHALAVAFSEHNAARTPKVDAGDASFVCAVSLPYKERGYDLVLWNVPGKAGRDVIAGLLDAVVGAMRVGGLLAAVIVHPLADLFTDGFDRADASITHVERGKEHTVVHVRRDSGAVVERHPFADGAFDRPAQRFETGELSWTLTPVVGLPEYDSVSHATELAVRAMRSVRGEPFDRWLVVEPGTGHIAVAASLLWPQADGEVRSRDALAVLATERALSHDGAVRFATAWGMEVVTAQAPVDLAVVALAEQAPAEELERVIARLGGLVAPDGWAILHGRSTEVARVERLLRKGASWRPGKPAKLRGSACVTLRHRSTRGAT